MSFFQFLNSSIRLFLDTSWLWMPPLLAVAFFESWMYYSRRIYWQGIKWIILEIKPPKDVASTPMIMEQVFAGFWGIFGTVGNKYMKYIKGMTQDYMSFELVGSNGEIHFFVRTPAKFRNLVESQIYSQYPQAEIREVEDYVGAVPPDVPNKSWDLWGTRLKLVKDDYYPIRTYEQQLDLVSNPNAPAFIDPLAGLMETMSKLQPGEQIWIQIFMRPTNDDWTKKAGKAAKDLIMAAIPATGEGPTMMAMLSPGEREVVSMIQKKASKKGFESKVQFAYIARREVLSMANVAAVMGLFNQFASLNTNSLRPDPLSITRGNYYIFNKQRKFYRQRKVMRLLRQRSFWEKGYILNIEELASLYHFPTTAVKAPMTPWLEMKKSEPPLGLPTG